MSSRRSRARHQGRRHYIVGQLLAGGFDLRNTAARLGHSGGGAALSARPSRWRAVTVAHSHGGAQSRCDDREPRIGGIKEAEEPLQRSRVARGLDAFRALARKHA